MRVLFMGTPDFAVVALRALIAHGDYEVCGVVTQPDKPSGRGYATKASAVKECALSCGIPVYQPQTLRDGAFAPALEQLSPDVIVVAAYGKILPSYVLHYPKYGCINIHGSLLPRYRGAAPIQRAMLDGEAVTGVTIMQMAEGLDTGDMYKKVTVPITEEDNFETLHDKLARAGADALLAVLPELEAGSAHPQKQNDALSTYAAKIEKSDCVLDFTRDARALERQIRALSPFPLAFCRLNGKLLKITSARWEAGTGEPGTVLSTEHDRIAIACGDGILAVTGVLPEGKRRMSAADFIRGRGIAAGDRVESTQ